MSAPGLLIRNGRVIDPAAGRDEVADVLMEDGRVAKVGKKLSARKGSDAKRDTIDAKGLWVVPGLIDMHAHLRSEEHTFELQSR